METKLLVQEQTIAKKPLSSFDLLRRKIKVNEQGLDNFIFKIAETKEELESAYQLVYDIYVKAGYIDPTSSHLRIKFFNAMPYSQTFITKIDDQVTMTMSLFPDSLLGVPLDIGFQKKLNEYRKQNRYLAEIGSYVSNVNNQKADLHLMKAVIFYAKEFLKIDDIIISVSPKHKNFYVHVLGFEVIGEIESYANIKGNPAYALKLDLNNYKNYFWDKYSREPIENDLYHFFFVRDSFSIKLPENLRPLHVWNAKLFSYFFKEKTDLYFKADDKTREIMNKYYEEAVYI
jgi:hypothetical protein